MEIVAPVTIYLYKNNRNSKRNHLEDNPSTLFSGRYGNENEVLKIKIERVHGHALPESKGLQSRVTKYYLRQESCLKTNELCMEGELMEEDRPPPWLVRITKRCNQLVQESLKSDLLISGPSVPNTSESNAQ